MKIKIEIPFFKGRRVGMIIKIREPKYIEMYTPEMFQWMRSMYRSNSSRDEELWKN